MRARCLEVVPMGDVSPVGTSHCGHEQQRSATGKGGSFALRQICYALRPKALRRSLLAGCFLSVFWVSVNSWLVHQSWTDSSVINFAGRLRMLTQKVHSDFLVEKFLSEHAAEMHEEDSSQETISGIKAISRGLLEGVGTAPEFLDETPKQMLLSWMPHTDYLDTQREKLATMDTSGMHKLLKEVQEMLHELDAIVDAASECANKRIWLLASLNVCRTVVAILWAAFVAAVFARTWAPYIKIYKEQVDMIEEQRGEIHEQKAELQIQREENNDQVMPLQIGHRGSALSGISSSRSNSKRRTVTEAAPLEVPDTTGRPWSGSTREGSLHHGLNGKWDLVQHYPTKRRLPHFLVYLSVSGDTVVDGDGKVTLLKRNGPELIFEGGQLGLDEDGFLHRFGKSEGSHQIYAARGNFTSSLDYDTISNTDSGDDMTVSSEFSCGGTPNSVSRVELPEFCTGDTEFHASRSSWETPLPFSSEQNEETPPSNDAV